MSKTIYAGCLLVTALLALAIRWLGDLFAPWAVGDETVCMTLLCCGPVTLALAFAFAASVVVHMVALRPQWRVIGTHCLGIILFGTFVYTSLPLMDALLSPVHPLEERVLLPKDCESAIRESTQYPSYYSPPHRSESWIDIDGDGEPERLERLTKRTGGTGFHEIVVIYESNLPRWCGRVDAWNSFLVAWIRPINLDLDLTPEIWMRDTDEFRHSTRGFLDFSADRVRAFDPRLTILFILLPLRTLPLLLWFLLRRKPIPCIVVTIATIAMYLLIS